MRRPIETLMAKQLGALQAILGRLGYILDGVLEQGEKPQFTLPETITTIPLVRTLYGDVRMNLPIGVHDLYRYDIGLTAETAGNQFIYSDTPMIAAYRMVTKIAFARATGDSGGYAVQLATPGMVMPLRYSTTWDGLWTMVEVNEILASSEKILLTIYNATVGAHFEVRLTGYEMLVPLE